jgi:hypothetical protein
MRGQQALYLIASLVQVRVRIVSAVEGRAIVLRVNTACRLIYKILYPAVPVACTNRPRSVYNPDQHSYKPNGCKQSKTHRKQEGINFNFFGCRAKLRQKYQKNWLGRDYNFGRQRLAALTQLD